MTPRRFLGLMTLFMGLIILFSALHRVWTIPETPIIGATTPSPAPKPHPRSFEAVKLNGIYTVRHSDPYWISPYDYPTCEKAQEVADYLWFCETNSPTGEDPETVRRRAERATLAWRKCGEVTP